MKSLRRLTMSMCALGAVALCACGDLAPKSFDGTWKTNPDQTRLSSEPETLSLNGKVYDCTSCKPVIHIRADGSDQPFSTTPTNTIAVTEINSKTAKITRKINGNVTSERIDEVSPDGRTLHTTNTVYPLKGGAALPITEEITWERIGQPVPNANAITGSWRMQKAGVAENLLFTTFKSNGYELSAFWPNGTSWTARLDGRDYPVKAALRIDSVSLMRLNDRRIEVTYKRHGYILRVDDLTVSEDGLTMTTVSQSNPSGNIARRIATRQ